MGEADDGTEMTNSPIPPEQEGTVGLHNALIRFATNEFAYLPEEYRLDWRNDGRVAAVHDLRWRTVDEPRWQPFLSGVAVSVRRDLSEYPRVDPMKWQESQWMEWSKWGPR